MSSARAAAVGLGGLGLILVALMFESAILFVPGVALILLAATVPGWIALAARGVTVTRTLDQDRVLEDQPLEATIRIAHGRLGLPGAEVIEPLAGGALSLRTGALHLRPAQAELRVVARFDRRGRRSLAPPGVRLSDPFGLVSFERLARGAQEILVLPRIERPRLRPHGSGRNPRSSSGARWAEALAVVEVDGLQPYRVGTPASRIHWPALARGAGLLERRLRAETGTGPLVVLDARCRDGERLDQAVRAAASLTHTLAAHGGCELLLPGERRAVKIEPDLGGWPAAHARLAVLDGGEAARAPALTPRQGPVYYVAPELFFDPWRGSAGVRVLEDAILVLPAEAAVTLAGAPVLEVSGCVGFALGALARGPAVVAAGSR